jgi:hypothetical protein
VKIFNTLTINNRIIAYDLDVFSGHSTKRELAKGLQASEENY